MDFKRYIISALATFCLVLNLVWYGAAVSSEPDDDNRIPVFTDEDGTPVFTDLKSEPDDEDGIPGIFIDENGIPVFTDLKIAPLNQDLCARCHGRIDYLLKSGGEKHRTYCQSCHDQIQFHYRPPFKGILPSCNSCHQQPHGKILKEIAKAEGNTLIRDFQELTQCITCHQQPHTPLEIPAGRKLDQACYICHPKQDRETQTYRTWHTEFYCSTCHHTKHGYKPQCLECHQRHADMMPIMDACITCHPPHQVRQVVYPADIPKKSCAVCHHSQNEMLERNNTKHSALHCTKCHPDKHRTTMGCQKCHAKPSCAGIHKNNMLCGQCHGPAHALRPVPRPGQL
jgi:hypothetical protein